MATVTASDFVSRSSQVNGHGSEPQENLDQIGSWSRSMTHNGLRSLNMVDKLQLRSPSKAFATKAANKAHATTTDKPSGQIICGHGMCLIFVGAEVGPWSKTGGLGDVLGGLPPELALRAGDKVYTIRYFHCYKRGVDRVLVDHPLFLAKVWGKTGSKIFGPQTGTDYADNQLQFALLCLAALEAPRVLNLTSNKNFSEPFGEDVVFVANDWHTALLPCYLKTLYQSRGIYATAKVAFCIHNIAYQGRFAFADFGNLNLLDSYKSSFDFMDGYNKPVKGRKIN